MDPSANGLDGEGRKVVAAPTIGLSPVILNELAASKMKKVVRRFEQWEIDAALAVGVSDDYVPWEMAGSPTHEDQEVKELRKEVAGARGLSREWWRQYQASIRQEYEAKGYVDMEFIVPIPMDEYYQEGKDSERKKGEKAP